MHSTTPTADCSTPASADPPDPPPLTAWQLGVMASTLWDAIGLYHEARRSLLRFEDRMRGVPGDVSDDTLECFRVGCYHTLWESVDSLLGMLLNFRPGTTASDAYLPQKKTLAPRGAIVDGVLYLASPDLGDFRAVITGENPNAFPGAKGMGLITVDLANIVVIGGSPVFGHVIPDLGINEGGQAC